MPTYSYKCEKCDYSFELFNTIREYNPQPKCVSCQSSKTYRLYVNDVRSQAIAVKKGDSELKTVGDLAKRNTDRMSDDQKTALYMKHNSYKETKEEGKPLPSGMNRIKKPPKTKWS